mmetsp:Transcript_16704/g.27903  ORF Transcript_16704/g.27903 Transcript_16704/m.27903 type:complete len:86 (-) Transcript_16704:285-542(-)
MPVPEENTPNCANTPNKPPPSPNDVVGIIFRNAIPDNVFGPLIATPRNAALNTAVNCGDSRVMLGSEVRIGVDGRLRIAGMKSKL